jgi:hypothetical protein
MRIAPIDLIVLVAVGSVVAAKDSRIDETARRRRTLA